VTGLLVTHHQIACQFVAAK